MKACFKCGEYLPLKEFYRHPQMADGHLGKCKECTKNDVKKHRRDNIEYYRLYDRSRANSPHRVSVRNKYAGTANGKAASLRAKKKYSDRNPLKRAVHVLVGNAMRDGKITKQPCEVCGSIRVQGHHDDYLKPFDIRWLCTTHHALHHKRLRGH